MTASLCCLVKTKLKHRHSVSVCAVHTHPYSRAFMHTQFAAARCSRGRLFFVFDLTDWKKSFVMLVITAVASSQRLFFIAFNKNFCAKYPDIYFCVCFFLMSGIPLLTCCLSRPLSISHEQISLLGHVLGA